MRAAVMNESIQNDMNCHFVDISWKMVTKMVLTLGVIKIHLAYNVLCQLHSKCDFIYDHKAVGNRLM